MQVNHAMEAQIVIVHTYHTMHSYTNKRNTNMNRIYMINHVKYFTCVGTGQCVLTNCNSPILMSATMH